MGCKECGSLTFFGDLVTEPSGSWVGSPNSKSLLELMFRGPSSPELTSGELDSLGMFLMIFKLTFFWFIALKGELLFML